MPNKRKNTKIGDNTNIQHVEKESSIAKTYLEGVEMTLKRHKSSSSDEDSDQDSLPRSPSAFRFTSLASDEEVKKQKFAKPKHSEFINKTSFHPLDHSPTTAASTSSRNDAAIPLKFENQSLADSKINQERVLITPINQYKPRHALLVHPPRLEDLPHDILKRILSHIMPVNIHLTPWFRFGTALSWDPSGGDIDLGITWLPNIDIAFLLVSKACHEIGTNILYGSNHFRLGYRDDTNCAKWWIKSIGDHNLNKVNKMTCILNSGWTFCGRHFKYALNPSHNSHEENWLSALSYIQYRKVKFEYLNVTTLHWNDLRRDTYYDGDAKDELDKNRKLIIDTLSKIRGVKRAEIQQIGTLWIGRESQKLTLLMQQPGWTLQEPPMAQLSILELLEHCKAEHELRANRLKEERKSRRGG